MQQVKLIRITAYELAKELFIVDGAIHIAVNDIQKYVDQVVTKLTRLVG